MSIGLSLMSMFLREICGVAPPHPDASIDAQEFYRSLHRPSLQTKLIHPAICEDMSVEKCSAWDHTMQDNARNLQEIVSKSGQLKVLVLLVRFTDHAKKELPPVSEFNSLFNSASIDELTVPTGSINAWFKANSLGRYQIDADVLDWMMTNNTEAFFSKSQSGISHVFRYSMYPILDELDKQGFDFSKFDQNKDGVIDSIVLLHSGYAAELGDYDCNTNSTSKDRIWSHAVGYSGDNWISERTGIRANSYSVGAGVRGRCYSKVPRLGTIVHEMMHTLGLPDLNDNGQNYVGKGLGIFDIMSNPNGRSGSQTYPGFLSPWSKMQVKWLEPIPIEYDGLYTIEASEETNQIYIIQKGYPEGEYLLIENRQPIQWDGLLWNGGLLIWHIDEAADFQRNRGYPGQSGWPGNRNHYRVALEQADRHYDLEKVSLWFVESCT
jgi:M6 family metalloprotease-like protein